MVSIKLKNYSCFLRHVRPLPRPLTNSSLLVIIFSGRPLVLCSNDICVPDKCSVLWHTISFT